MSPPDKAFSVNALSGKLELDGRRRVEPLDTAFDVNAPSGRLKLDRQRVEPPQIGRSA